MDFWTHSTDIRTVYSVTVNFVSSVGSFVGHRFESQISAFVRREVTVRTFQFWKLCEYWDSAQLSRRSKNIFPPNSQFFPNVNASFDACGLHWDFQRARWSDIFAMTYLPFLMLSLCWNLLWTYELFCCNRCYSNTACSYGKTSSLYDVHFSFSDYQMSVDPQSEGKISRVSAFRPWYVKSSDWWISEYSSVWVTSCMIPTWDFR